MVLKRDINEKWRDECQWHAAALEKKKKEEKRKKIEYLVKP